jgi:hypothetical protein
VTFAYFAAVLGSAFLGTVAAPIGTSATLSAVTTPTAFELYVNFNLCPDRPLTELKPLENKLCL